MNTVQTSEFTGLNFADVMNKVTQYVRPVIEAAQVGNQELTEKYYDVMIAKLNEAKELVIEEKTFQYQFKEYNDNFNNWEISLTYINKFLKMDFQATIVKILNNNK